MIVISSVTFLGVENVPYLYLMEIPKKESLTSDIDKTKKTL
jgi:hypothetical protein